MSQENKNELDIYQRVAKYASFGISLCSTSLYMVEKVARVPEIVIENINADGILENPIAQAAKRPLATVATVFSTINYICKFTKYASPVHGYLQNTEDKILCCKVKDASPYLVYMPFYLLILGVAGFYLSETQTVDWIKGKHKHYKKAISLISNTISFGSGVLLLATIVKDPKTMKGRELFSVCSILDGLTAPMDFPGIDNLVFRIDNQGYAYGGLYGVRAAVKLGQSIGFITADN